MNKAIASLSALMLVSGCYRTAPTEWRHQSTGPVIDWRHDVPNGSQLAIGAKIEGKSLVISTLDIPLCRQVEEGKMVTREVGEKEIHTWPFGATMLVSAVVGSYLFLDNYDDATNGESDDIEPAIYTGIGAPLAVIGTLMFFGAVGGSDFSMEPELETRQKRVPLKQWASEGRKKCFDGQVRYAPNISVDMEIRFERGYETVKLFQMTDATGSVSVPFALDIGRTAAHCGDATITIRGSNWKPDRRTHLDDAPNHPSQHRDEYREFEFKVSSSKKVDPSEINDSRFMEIAYGCANRVEEECLGRDREYQINLDCKHGCNEQAGAVYCSVQQEIDLSLQGISREEKRLAEKRYDACVEEEGVTQDQTRECFQSCVNTEREKACPKGW